MFAEKAFKGASITEFVDEIEVVGGFEHVVVFDDVGVCFDVGEDVDFVDCALF